MSDPGTFFGSSGGTAAPASAFPGSSGNVGAAVSSTIDGSDLTPAQANALLNIRRVAGRVPVITKRGEPGQPKGTDLTATQISELSQIKSAVGPQPTPGAAPPVSPGADQIHDYNDVVFSIDNMDPAAVASIQQQLLNGHFYSNSYYGKNGYPVIPGEVDPGTRSAWKKAVTEAALQQKTPDEILQGAADAAKKAGMVAPQVGPRVTLTNPDDLRAAALAAGERVLGRRPDPGAIDNIVAAYHSAEANASQPQADGSFVNKPSDPQAFAENVLRHLYPVDAKVNDTLNVGNEIVNRLAAPAGSNLPTTGAVNG